MYSREVLFLDPAINHAAALRSNSLRIASREEGTCGQLLCASVYAALTAAGRVPRSLTACPLARAQARMSREVAAATRRERRDRPSVGTLDVFAGERR